MIKHILTIVSFTFISSAFTQVGQVTVHKDERIETLIKQKGAIIPPATAPQMSGFRVQLIFDSNKKLVDDAKVKFVADHPKVDTYVTYNAPHFVLKVGDFRTKQDAERFREMLMRDYPTSFVIKETINLPRID